jgi:hypothetical protein
MSDEIVPQPPSVRASDADRDHGVAQLRTAVSTGQLTLEEFSDRVGLALAAQTRQQLEQLVVDLPAPLPPASPAAAAPRKHRAVCSHLVRSGSWSVPLRSSWRSLFGTIDLDLRQARLTGSQTEIDVHNTFGTVTVVVPEGVEVVVEGGGLFATQKVESPERPPVAGGPVLTIFCHGPGGTLRVCSNPSPQWLQSLQRALTG